jgi:hypothetical protein
MISAAGRSDIAANKKARRANSKDIRISPENLSRPPQAAVMPHKDLDHRPVKSTNPSGYLQSKKPDKPAIQRKNDRSRADAANYFCAQFMH